MERDEIPTNALPRNSKSYLMPLKSNLGIIATKSFTGSESVLPPFPPLDDGDQSIAWKQSPPSLNLKPKKKNQPNSKQLSNQHEPSYSSNSRLITPISSISTKSQAADEDGFSTIRERQDHFPSPHRVLIGKSLLRTKGGFACSQIDEKKKRSNECHEIPPRISLECRKKGTKGITAPIKSTAPSKGMPFLTF